jgi:hypothetical protein
MSKMTVSKESGTTPEAIANYLLQKKDWGDIPKAYRARLENWIINENNQNHYELNTDISVPDDKEIIKITLVQLPFIRGDEKPEMPQPNPEPEGWTLTKDGDMVKGTTSFLIDENSYYILKDGRRVNIENVVYNGKDLRIGAEKPEEGFRIIMEGSDLAEPSSTPLEKYKVYDDLLKSHGAALKNLVVYQVFQINRGYDRTGSSWQDIPSQSSSIAQFKLIGSDETGIPIIVTRIGNENAAHKLVIAGPHGDKRNAQRLVMAAQQYFIKEGGVPTDTVLYFIPCLSPTMCFADARGIPNMFLDGWQKDVPMGNGPFVVNSSLKIPELYDNMKYEERTKLQYQKNQKIPM